MTRGYLSLSFAILLPAYLLSGCGSDTFSGSSGSAERKGKSADVTADTETSDLTPGEIDERCDADGKLLASALDFEQAANADTRSAFWATHGMRFISDTKKSLTTVKTTRLGDPEPPSAERAWLCIRCAGLPNYNRLADAVTEGHIKDYTLANIEAMANRRSNFRIEFKDPPNKITFDLVDVDGGESWKFSVMDKNGQEIPDAKINGYTSPTYGIKKSDNGKYKAFEINTTSEKIAAIAIAGAKKSAIFGFALDNIDAGFDLCKNRD